MYSYFTELYQASISFVEAAKLPPIAYSLERIVEEQKPELFAERENFTTSIRPLRELLNKEPEQTKQSSNPHPGLNTVGMLSDRLTILIMKEWVLRNRNDQADDADKVRQTQTEEIIEALAHSTPGYSSITGKITSLHNDIVAKDWENTFFGLLSINVLLWESQELLYAGNIDKAPSEELRRYIAWFSEGNIIRNEYISKCETTFWELLK